MTNSIKKTAATHMGAALIVCTAVLLTGCKLTDNPDMDNIDGSQAFYDRYPIKVKTNPATGRKVAVTKECGDWSDNLAANQANEPYRNLGCATQNNIAAMVSNPNDFVKPRAMTPIVAPDRTSVMTIFYTPKANVVSSSNN